MVRATRPNELMRQFLTNHIDPEAKPAFGVRSLAVCKTGTVTARVDLLLPPFPQFLVDSFGLHAGGC